jgi:thymidylate kinase
MKDINQIYNSISEFLNTTGEYVVLRNHDIRNSLVSGGDVDVLVRDMPLARRSMVAALGSPWWIMSRTYVEGYFYSWGHIDLTPRIEWHGAVYIDNETIFTESLISKFGFKMPRQAHEALICWFSSLIWGGVYKERYTPTLLSAADKDPESFLKCLIYAVGKKWGNRLFSLVQDRKPGASVVWVGQLRRALWWRGFQRRPLLTTFGCLSFWCKEILMRIKPPVPWVAILGMDGSGKSTLLEGVRKEWDKMGLKAIFLHWRPEYILPKKSDGHVSNPHGQKPRGLFSSTLKLLFIVADWTIGFRIILADKRARGYFIIFDRFYNDMLVDPIRYRYGGGQSLARCTFRFLPQPDAIILLDAPADIVHARKPEITLDALRKLRCAYIDLMQNHSNCYIVNANRPISFVLNDVLEIIKKTIENYSIRYTVGTNI